MNNSFPQAARSLTWNCRTTNPIRYVLLAWAVALIPLRAAGQGDSPSEPATPLAASRQISVYSVDGRLQLVMWNQQNGPNELESDSNRVVERVRTFGDRIRFAYELSWDANRLEIERTLSGVRMERRGNSAERPAFQFDQPASGPLELTVEHEGAAARYSADNLWQLALLAGTDFESTVAATVGILRPRWRLTQLVDEVRSQMLAAARQGDLPDVAAWNALVRQLSAPRFADRRAAERALIDEGEILEPYLARLDRANLDAEQRSRLASVEMEIATQLADTPARAASAHLADATSWVGIARNSTGPTRRLALEAVAEVAEIAAPWERFRDAGAKAAEWSELLRQVHSTAKLPRDESPAPTQRE